ncbi:5'/3'-nucleotidase SurE [Aneurinibacillus aneurinilyticus]|jgi:5'-nucleotidase|uniref:5'/3'-nucleotidase SurE n=1 Tax=Aneurinibacillus aneurinilyticus TaxID=1391 RepID=UPI0035253E4E
MYKVVVTNDDGIHALGIHKLVKSLDGLAEIIVVAPDTERSAEGQRITVREGLTVKRVDFHGMKHIQAWAVNGTPADCVKMAINVILRKRPDLVISGINAGLNLGKDIYYSGTVSAAREAVIYEVPAIAVSYENHFHKDDFGEVEKLVRPIWEEIKIHDIPVDVLININVPHIKSAELRGVVVTGLDIHHYRDRIDERPGVSGVPEYWLDREYGELKKINNRDYHMIRNKYITMTPIQIDSTDYTFFKKMEEWKVIKKNLLEEE